MLSVAGVPQGGVRGRERGVSGSNSGRWTGSGHLRFDHLARDSGLFFKGDGEALGFLSKKIGF